MSYCRLRIKRFAFHKTLAANSTSLYCSLYNSNYHGRVSLASSQNTPSPAHIICGFLSLPRNPDHKKWTGNISTEPQFKQSQETLLSNPVHAVFIKWHNRFSWSQQWFFSTALCANLVTTLCSSARGKNSNERHDQLPEEKILKTTTFLLSPFCSLLQEIPATRLCGPETV